MVFVVVFGIYFVNAAAPGFAVNHASPNNLYANRTASSILVNLTINASSAQLMNITGIIITLPTGFSYITGTNNSNNATMFNSNGTFYNTSATTLIWSNNSRMGLPVGDRNGTMLIGASDNNNSKLTFVSLWFNISGSPSVATGANTISIVVFNDSWNGSLSSANQQTTNTTAVVVNFEFA